MYNLWIEQKEALGLHGITNKILWGYFCTKNLHESVIDLFTYIWLILHLATRYDLPWSNDNSDNKAEN